ncbi:MAG TPA: alpha-L-arabinofuranosidase C-terminal domain-containing protein, partial [Flavisolibacter sp.]
DAKLLPLQLQSGYYAVGDQKLPAISGSASVDSLGRTHVSLVNIDAKTAQEVSISVEGGKFNAVAGRILQAATLQDHNSFQSPSKIQPAAFTGASLSGSTLKVKLPPFSVVVLELK